MSRRHDASPALAYRARPMKVWLNGNFVDASEAKLSIFDASVQHSVGLFETMGAINGRIFRGREHMRRLANSARDLLLTERLSVEPLVEAAQLAVSENGMQQSRVRLTITGGDLSELPATGRSTSDPTIFIIAQPPTPYPEEFFEQGVIVTVADGRLNPFDPMAGHKTINYWPRIRTLQVAASRGAAESLWFTVSNHLASGSVSNIFLVKDGSLMTPIARGEEEAGAIPSTVLPGITRAAIIELAEQKGLTILKRMLDIEDVLGADEVFLTNSSWGVLPVKGVERESIGDGAVGSLTRELRRGWEKLREDETANG